jgi:hypothetical protein
MAIENQTPQSVYDTTIASSTSRLSRPQNGLGIRERLENMEAAPLDRAYVPPHQDR